LHDQEPKESEIFLNILPWNSHQLLIAYALRWHSVGQSYHTITALSIFTQDALEVCRKRRRYTQLFDLLWRTLYKVVECLLSIQVVFYYNAHALEFSLKFEPSHDTQVLLFKNICSADIFIIVFATPNLICVRFYSLKRNLPILVNFVFLIENPIGRLEHSDIHWIANELILHIGNLVACCESLHELDTKTLLACIVYLLSMEPSGA